MPHRRAQARRRTGQDSRLTEERLDASLRRLPAEKFRLGPFDPDRSGSSCRREQLVLAV
jgi:hypothetical protein